MTGKFKKKTKSESNKQRYIKDPQIKLRIAKKLKGNQHTLGKHWKVKDTSKYLGKNSLGHKHNENTKRKQRESHIVNPNKKFKNTDIELKMEKELKRRNVNYQKQVPLCKIAVVDFYLPEYRTIIQCDGDYWHNLPGSRKRSERQDKVLTFNGFNVYRFWGHEINESVKKCIDKLKINL